MSSLRTASGLVLSALVLVLSPTCLADLVQLGILQTTDVHGYIETSGEPEAGGGWLRLATLIEQFRESWGESNTLLVDCGDACQGSIVAAVSRGKVCVDLLNALDYDVFIPGNHELDFGVQQCDLLCQAAGERVLCGNLQLTVAGRERSFRGWRIFERHGARIAVIGATASFLDHWLWGTKMAHVSVQPVTAMLRQVMPEVLGTRPDMIVLAVHQGWLERDTRQVNEIPDIVRQFPEIDLVLGGHTHRLRPGIKLGSKTWYVQAGMHAGHLAVVEAVVDTDRHEVQSITSRLVPADRTVPVNERLRRIILPWLSEAEGRGRETVGILSEPLSASGTPGQNCQTSELICQAIAAATGADVVLHGRLSRAGLAAGPVTVSDLFALIPYENNIALAELSRTELVEVIEEQLSMQGSYAYNGIWGVDVISGDSLAVRDLSLPGGRTSISGRLTVALNSYAVAGAGGRFPRLRAAVRRPDANLRDTGLETRAVLRAFIAKQSPLSLTARSWLRSEAQ